MDNSKLFKTMNETVVHHPLYVKFLASPANQRTDTLEYTSLPQAIGADIQ